MLWKSKKAVEATTARAEPVSAPSERDDADKALDAVSRLLRDYGRYAFDLAAHSGAEIRRDCEAWASKIVIGTGKTGDAEEPSVRPRRDWPSLFQFFATLRKEESAYVVQSLEDLRDAVCTFARHVSSAIDQERAEDVHVRQHLTELSTAIESGDTGKLRIAAEDVVRIVGQSLEAHQRRHVEQMQELGQKLRDLNSELDEANKQAQLDPLTQLSNRAVFDARIARLAEFGALFERPPCLLLVDVDHFKAVNDTFGHPAGDEALKRLSDTLIRTFVRKQDLVCRYGGEEFGIVLVETDRKGGEMLGERLLETVRKLEIVYGGCAIPLRVSMGLAVLRPGESATSWLERVDKALYAAKAGGRDRLVSG